MATNVYAPNGLLYSQNYYGGAPTVQATPLKIKKGYGTTIGFGDVVQTGTGGNQGYVTLGSFGGTYALGVFCGVLPYYDSTQQAIAHGLNGSYQSTSNPAADIDCLVYTDPGAVYRAQATNGTWAWSMRGQNVNWVSGSNGAPNASGISTLGLDLSTLGTSNTLPFRIIGVAGVPGGPQDPANANPLILVTFNPAYIEALQGTGI